MMNEVLAPIGLLTSRKLTASAKLLWLVLSWEARSKVQAPRPLSLNRLASRTGLGRSTVHRALTYLRKSGLLPTTTSHSMAKAAALVRGAQQPPPHQRPVAFPVDLLCDRSLSAQARIMYGILQASFLTGPTEGECTYARLRSFTTLHVRTLKRAIFELSRSGWISTSQKNKRTPIRFLLRNPVSERWEAELALVQRRIARAEHKGEALMREYLTKLVDTEEYDDDASPGYLVNPATKERLQFDRYYPNHGVAFEFNGLQHYVATEKYSEEASTRQRVRDLIKVGLSFYRGVTLKVLHPKDLSLEGVRRMVGNLLPLRELVHDDPVIAYLEVRSRRYRRNAKREIGKLMGKLEEEIIAMHLGGVPHDEVWTEGD